MEPVGTNTYEAYPAEHNSAQAAYAQAANGYDSQPAEMANQRTSGHSIYHTPQGVPQHSNEYFDGTKQRY